MSSRASTHSNTSSTHRGAANNKRRSNGESRRPNWEPQDKHGSKRYGDSARSNRRPNNHESAPGMESLADMREGRRKPRHHKGDSAGFERRDQRTSGDRDNRRSGKDEPRRGGSWGRDDRRKDGQRSWSDNNSRGDSGRWGRGRNDDDRRNGRRDDRRDNRRSDNSRGDDRRDRPNYAKRDDRFGSRSDDRRQSGRRWEDRGSDNRRRDDSRDSGFRRDDRRSSEHKGFRRDDRSNFGHRGEDRRSVNSRSADSRGGDRRNDGRRRDDRHEAPRGDRRSSDRKPFGEQRSETSRYVAPTTFAPSKPVEAAQGTEAQATASFLELGVDARAVEALKSTGITSPMPIQTSVIPDAVGGRDILGRGRTGSGKTVAFAAPIITRLVSLDPSRARGREPRALILAPTRELVAQINKTLEPLAKAAGMFTLALVGGVPQRRQVLALQKGVDIVIATPGRLEDLQNQGHISLDNIRIIAVDEADEMCDMGFIEPLDRIFDSIRENAQHMLFSATLDHDVQRLVDKYFKDPVLHDTGDESQSQSDITHLVFVADRNEKVDVVAALAEEAGRSIIFTKTRAYSQMLADDLDEYGVSAVAMHGDLKQHQRQRNLKRLETGEATTLVATDVAARGLHIDDLPLVIQADMAEDPKSYIHRSGRTGRAGATGIVVSIVPPRGQRKAERILEAAEIEAPMLRVTARNAVEAFREYVTA